MKKSMFCLVVMVLILSCSNATKKSETAERTDKKEESKAADTPPMPYKAAYSSQFTVGEVKHAEKILTLFKQWDNNKMAEGKSLFADSVHYFTNGWEFHGTNDSFFTVSKVHRDKYKEVRTLVQAWIPVHSADKNEDWVLVWSTAYTTDNKGKVDSASYQDTWKVNSAGRFDVMYDYELKAPAPAVKK